MDYSESRSFLYSIINKSELQQKISSTNQAVASCAQEAQLIGLSTVTVVMEDDTELDIGCDRALVEPNGVLSLLNPDGYLLASFSCGNWKRYSLVPPKNMPHWSML